MQRPLLLLDSRRHNSSTINLTFSKLIPSLQTHIVVLNHIDPAPVLVEARCFCAQKLSTSPSIFFGAVVDSEKVRHILV